jgi:hypothetical protein
LYTHNSFSVFIASRVAISSLADCSTTNDRSNSMRWLHFNDNKVTLVDEDEVAAQKRGAYIFFYRRRDLK